MPSSTALALLILAAQATAPVTAQAPAPIARPTPDGAVLAIDTSMGTIEVGLYATKSPLSTRNILNYVKAGFYSGTLFHRVIPGFMVQGGGLDAKMVEKPVGPPVRNEARNGLLNTRGSVALARTGDPHSATAQFFINVKDNPALDFGISRDGWGYTVFGEVLSGMDVVDRIVAVPTTRMVQYDNVPITPVVITKVRVISEPAPVAPPAATKAAVPAAKPGSAPAKRAPKPSAKPSPKASPRPSM
ncbi:MAG: peptidyl-prolyl cis-trans isomerase [Vicinamibacteria bacterium]|nr:peptidyl-prolyl cis-trans isomerase [Vicinamibacteria bacterium]